MRKSLSLALMALLTLGAGSVALAGSYTKQKVVYHVNYDDAKAQKAALRNIQNHINAVGAENLDLRVVMHGKGVTLVQRANKDMDLQSKIANLKKQGIHFNVCRNTLLGKKLNYKNDLYDVSEEDIVPSGVAEIAKLEQEGYAYIKP